MKDFFHCDANMYRRKVRTFLEYTAAPVAFIAVFLTVCLLLSLHNLMNSGLIVPAVVIIGIVIFLFALVTRIMISVSEHLIKVHSRYTYIEIGLKDVIVSLYAGSFIHFGKKTTLRKLFVIPLDEFLTAEVCSGRKGLVLIKGKIRAYTGNTDRLGYYYKDGNLHFKEFYYQVSGFSELLEMVVPHRFADAYDVVETLIHAKERFDNLPAPRAYIFEEMSHVKEKRIQKRVRRARGFWGD